MVSINADSFGFIWDMECISVLVMKIVINKKYLQDSCAAALVIGIHSHNYVHQVL